MVALCAVLGSVALPVWAQQAQPAASGTAQDNDKGAPAKPEKAVQMKALSVVANRYDATNMRMDSVNTVEVLSASDLQRTAVHNVAEALGLMSGVNVTTTGTGYFGGIDGAARGEGMFASVRGLPSEYNVNLINGSNIAQGMPYSRSVQLSLLPPSGLQTIVLNKTAMADMDGDAIGGTIDFRTPSAFDFKKDFSGSVTASGRSESRARDYGGSGLGGGLAGELQGKFGAEKQSASMSAAITTTATSPTARSAPPRARRTTAPGPSCTRRRKATTHRDTIRRAT